MLLFTAYSNQFWCQHFEWVISKSPESLNYFFHLCIEYFFISTCLQYNWSHSSWAIYICMQHILILFFVPSSLFSLSNSLIPSLQKCSFCLFPSIPFFCLNLFCLSYTKPYSHTALRRGSQPWLLSTITRETIAPLNHRVVLKAFNMILLAVRVNNFKFAWR